MKKILWLIGIPVLLIVIFAVSIPLWIDGAARKAIELGGTETLKVATTVDGIRLGLLEGTCRIEGLEVANPEGFKHPYFIRLGEGTVAVSIGTVFDDKIVLPKLVFDSLSMNLERVGTKTNYETILDNIEETVGEADESGGKKIVIEELVIRNVKVIYNVSLIGVIKPGVPLHVDEIRMTNVGADGEGVSMGQMIGIVITGVLKGVGKAGTGILPDDVTGGISKGVKGVGKAGTGLLKGIGGLFGK